MAKIQFLLLVTEDSWLIEIHVTEVSTTTKMFKGMEIISKPSNLITSMYFTRLCTASLLFLTIPALEFLFWLIYFKYFISYYSWYDKWAVSHLKPCLFTNIFHPDRSYGVGVGFVVFCFLYELSIQLWVCKKKKKVITCGIKKYSKIPQNNGEKETNNNQILN